MNKLFLLFSSYRIRLFVLLLSSHLNSIIILVHGSFARNESWHQPGGDFFEALKKHTNEEVISFSWSGKLRETERLLAAKHLAEFLLAQWHHPQIFLIGHSHGGNVIALMTQMLGIYFGNTPKIMLDDRDINNSAATLDVCPNNPAWTSSLLNAWKDSLFNPLPYTKKLPAIFLCLLGTPVDTTRYMPNMTYVQQCFNIHSYGDFVQTVLGQYERTFIAKERITNISITFETSDGFTYCPPHDKLHDLRLIPWLLNLPCYVKETTSSLHTHFQACGKHIYTATPPTS